MPSSGFGSVYIVCTLFIEVYYGIECIHLIMSTMVSGTLRAVRAVPSNNALYKVIGGDLGQAPCETIGAFDFVWL